MTHLPSLELFATNYFRAAEKSNLKIGGEWEMIGFHQNTHQRLKMEDLAKLIQEFIHLYQAEPVFEGENLIGANFVKAPFSGATITLEPGGQLEWSSSVSPHWSALAQELDLYTQALTKIAKALGFYFLSLGYDPFHSLQNMPRLPKKRYEVMKNYLPQFGKSVHNMMLGTGSFQVSVDYTQEEDWKKKLIASQYLTPFVIALFRNSSFEETALRHYAFRSEIWEGMDKKRVGFIPQSFGNFQYQNYIQFALSIPMLVVMRNGLPLDMGGKSFSSFWEGKEQIPALQKDWSYHLRSIFTWVRAKNCLELRAADASSLKINLAQAFFWIGLLYDPLNLENLYQKAQNFTLAKTEERTKNLIKNSLSKAEKEELKKECWAWIESAEIGFQRTEMQKEEWALQKFQPLQTLENLWKEKLEQTETLEQKIAPQFQSLPEKDKKRKWVDFFQGQGMVFG